MIDAHCHLTDARLFDRVDPVIADSHRVGVDRFVLGGVCPDEWDRQLDLKQRYPSEVAMVWGLHPWWVHEEHERGGGLEHALLRLQREASKLSGIGELGLDQIRGKRSGSRRFQEQAYRAQLDIAREFGKPIVLHVVQSHSEAIEALKGHSWTGIVHSFAADLAVAQRYIDLGLKLSISGRVTHPDARALRETVTTCPREALVFETDSPDQPPLGLSSDHTPQSLVRVVEEVARLRKQDPEELIVQSTRTLERIFDWKPTV